jgi:diacylglycerol kinase family enzyme
MFTEPSATARSALFIVNSPSGSGRTRSEINRLQEVFNDCLGWVKDRVFTVTSTHADVADATRRFLNTHRGPFFLLSGGGGGTNRALVQGAFEAVEKNLVCLDDVLLSSLRLGSGNLIPRYFGLPRDPIDGMRRIASDLRAGAASRCCAYRCSTDPAPKVWRHYGLTMGGLGEFAHVPDDIKRWRARHTRFMRWATRALPLETINSLQYIAFSLARAARCIVYPGRAAQVEVRQADRRERFRLLAGFLLNFDFPELPIRAGCAIGEPRLALCCIPIHGRGRTLRALVDWHNLDRAARKFEITAGNPLEIQFLDNRPTTLALDEDTFPAPARMKFEIAGLMRFVTGTAAGPRRVPALDLSVVPHLRQEQMRGAP